MTRRALAHAVATVARRLAGAVIGLITGAVSYDAGAYEFDPAVSAFRGMLRGVVR